MPPATAPKQATKSQSSQELTPEKKGQLIRTKMLESLSCFPDQVLARRVIETSINYLLAQDKMARPQDKKLLMECSETSICRSIYSACFCGLAIDGDRAYGIPYGDQMVFTPHYTGLAIIAKRNDKVLDVRSYLRREGDVWQYRRQNGPDVFIHEPADECGEIIGAYCEVTFRDETPTYREYLSREDLDKIRAASPLYSSKGKGPWVDWEGEMSRKASVKRALKHAALDDPRLDEALFAVNNSDALAQAIEATEKLLKQQRPSIKSQLDSMSAPETPQPLAEGEISLRAHVIADIDAMTLETMNEVYDSTMARYEPGSPEAKQAEMLLASRIQDLRDEAEAVQAAPGQQESAAR